MKITHTLKANVMRNLGIVFIGALLTFNVGAQAFQNKTNVITLGAGFDPYYSHYASYGYNYKKSAVGPFILAYERGITELLGIGRIGVGGSVGQSFYTSRSFDNNNYEYIDRTSRTAIFVRAAYHFDFGIDKLDVYAGVGGGAYVRSETHKSSNPNYVFVSKKGGVVDGGPTAFGGVRYYFTDAFGVYGEVGYGMTAISGGLAFKF